MAGAAARNCLLALGATCCLLACADGELAAPRALADDWVEEVACSGAFSFFLPADLEQEPLLGAPADSCVATFASADMTVKHDYGAFSSDLSEFRDEADHEEWIEAVDGRAARFVTSTVDPRRGPLQLRTSVVFVEVGSPPGMPGTRLTMTGLGRGERERQDALRTYRSIDFAD